MGKQIRQSEFKVGRGQVYRTKNRTTGHWRYLKIIRLTRAAIRQPCVTVREITRTGTLAYGKSAMGFSKSERFIMSLTWDGRQWSMRPEFERFEELETV